MSTTLNQIPEYAIEVPRGTTKRVRLGLRANKVPVPLAGYAAKLQVRECAGAEVVLIDLSSENGGIEIDAAGGIVTLVFPAAATAALELEGQYDLLLKNPQGEIAPVLRGTVVPVNMVTQWS